MLVFLLGLVVVVFVIVVVCVFLGVVGGSDCCADFSFCWC